MRGLARNIHTPAAMGVRDQTKDKLYKLANSISGYQNDPYNKDRSGFDAS